MRHASTQKARGLKKVNKTYCTAHFVRGQSRAEGMTYAHAQSIPKSKCDVQGSANPQTPGLKNKRIKSCVLLPAAGRRTQLFHLIFSEPGVCGSADPCTARRSASTSTAAPSTVTVQTTTAATSSSRSSTRNQRSVHSLLNQTVSVGHKEFVESKISLK